MGKRYSHKTGGYLGAFIVILGCLLAAGIMDVYSSSPSSLVTTSQAVSQPPTSGLNKPGHQAETIPDKLSKLDGWHGVKLVRKHQGIYSYCSFKFPKRFGLHDNSERGLLLGLTRDRHRGIKADIDDCMVSYDSAYYQIFRLAVAYQDEDAARWFVMPRGDSSLNLDGEWAETYDLEYRPKVLINFRDLRRIVSVEEEPVLAAEICAVVATSSEAYLDGAGISPVIDALRKHGMHSLATTIQRECGQK